MKKIAVITLSTILFAACGNSPQPVANGNTANAAKDAATTSNTNSLIVSGHRTESQPTPPTASSTTGGSPMQKPTDVDAQTAAIDKADKALKAKPTDDAAKKELAKAYFDRAFILTNAAQYSAALGDFRKGLKLDPSDTKAKEMHDQIVEIYGMVGKPVPKEGEEMAPNQQNKPK
ncbi:MAG: tetratricopeptide repeat protein [Acidobacteria bacterium]|nr:tetratricopeptide repeat protein [Acidobacteriota bacterium]